MNFILRSRKLTESQRKEPLSYKRPNLNHTDYAYREAVDRLKSMLTESYSAVKQNTRRITYDSDDADNTMVIVHVLNTRIPHDPFFSHYW